MPHKDLYRILGVADDASPQAIRRAYRRLARAVHPDAPGSGGAYEDAARFREIHDAYAVLTDPERRSIYDRTRERPRAGVRRRAAESLRTRAEPRAGSYSASRLWPSEEAIDRFWPNWFDVAPFGREARRGRRFRLNVVLEPDEARFGCRLPIEVPVRTACPRCGGVGGFGFWECVTCAGVGAVETVARAVLEIEPGIRGSARYEISLGRVGREGIVLDVTVSVR